MKKLNAERAYLALADAIRRTGEPACMTTDPEAWFPEKGNLTRENMKAIELCNVCPVKAECLTFALSNNEPFGIWGGMPTPNRSRLKKKTLAA